MRITLDRLAAVSTAAMYLVLFGGSLVTNTGSGDGCGASWPLCHGQVLPTFTVETAIEFSHRLASGIAGLLVVWLSFRVWRELREHRLARWMAALALGFLLLQSWLGAAAVLWPQPKAVMAAHFGVSLISFASVLILWVLVRGQDGAGRAPVRETLRRWAWLSIGYVYVVVYTGAYVRHTGSDLACLGWPLCNGEFWPPLRGPVGIHFAHRLAAAGAILVLGRLLALAARERGARPEVYRAAAWALGLTLLQALAGGLVVLTHLNLAFQMLHSAIVVLVFGVLSYICLQVSPRAAAPPADRPAVAVR